MKKNVRVFAPGTVANMGCGFDVMGMALNGVGDIVSVSVSEGDGLVIENKTISLRKLKIPREHFMQRWAQ